MKKICLCLMFTLMVLTVGCGRSPSAQEIELEDMHNGILLIYNNQTQDEQLHKAVLQAANQSNTNVVLLNLDEADDQASIAKYVTDHEEEIQTYKEIRELEAGLKRVRVNSEQTSSEADAARNEVMMDYKFALNIIKSPELHPEDIAELQRIIISLAERQELNKDELLRLLELQRKARISVPLYNETDGDHEAANLPILKIVYNDNVMKSVRFGQEPIPAEVRHDEEQLQQYLNEHAWLNKFNEDIDMSAIESIDEKLKRKESFVLLLYGDTCPHCHKLMPYLDQYEADKGYKTIRLNMYLEKNAMFYAKLVADHQFPELKWYPTLVAVEKGQAVKATNPYDYGKTDAASPLGYQIDEAIILDLLKQYAE
ncbi:hypothetical protein [Paenibacillus marinisediminis]